MPQENFVVKCYCCAVFQAHILKNSNQWQCKMCGEKQSVKKVYLQGTGKDCRKLVQHLNILQAEGKTCEVHEGE
ncbi:MRN complex-interacting protein [Lycorma delicatula]|uniref:MRN complex-interacting protein n=1 Tax=Lycorma delicatula TaxID=130591 RepID=UPI003F51121D